MCLYVGNKIRLVAQNDITVYKELKKKGDGWVTPHQNTDVTLNEIMRPSPVKCLHEVYHNKFQIKGGVIHAYLKAKHVAYKYFFKVIIKAGTAYYVQDDFTEIAAEELYITDEQVSGELISPDMNQICSDYLKATFELPEYQNNDGVKVGYFRLSDGTYANPLNDFDHSKAIGVVAFFQEDGTPVSMTLEGKELPWLTEYDMKNKVMSNINCEECETDFDGKKHTYDISHGPDYDPEKFKPIEYCVSYKTEGTNEGDWYLGSTGEMIKVAQNMCVVNAAMILTGVGRPLDFDWYWTSSECTWDGHSHVWYCFLYNGNCLIRYDYRDFGEVRPLSAF